MPLYEYDCDDCGNRFSTIQPVGTTAEETVCTACGSKNVKKVISAFSFGAGGGSLMPPMSSGGGG